MPSNEAYNSMKKGLLILPFTMFSYIVYRISKILNNRREN